MEVLKGKRCGSWAAIMHPVTCPLLLNWLNVHHVRQTQLPLINFFPKVLQKCYDIDGKNASCKIFLILSGGGLKGWTLVFPYFALFDMKITSTQSFNSCNKTKTLSCSYSTDFTNKLATFIKIQLPLFQYFFLLIRREREISYSRRALTSGKNR